MGTHALALILLMAFAAQSAATPRTLDQLLDSVRAERVQESREAAAREQRFIEARDQQRALLEQAKQELVQEQQREQTLKAAYEENAHATEQQQEMLDEASRSLGHLHDVVRQVAGDVAAIVRSSLVSAQMPGRDVIVGALAQSDELPALSQLETLWHMMLEQVVESGKVVEFQSNVIASSGEQFDREVVRVGAFTAVSDGRFLRFLTDTGQLMEPPKQPPERYQKMAVALQQADSGAVPMVVDPTRGTMLAMLIQTPDLNARIRQGGVVGYAIIALGVLAVLIAMERFVVLVRIGAKIRRQLQRDTADPDNPLGRILMVYRENPGVDAETLGLKLDEAVLRELPRIQRGLGTLAILAAVAPLLGLLGTVTGIIETFQSILLFGTGDPRLMSGGISQALVTTVMGLVVAIPILIVHSLLSARGNRLIQILDEKSAAAVARLAERKHVGST